MNTNLTPLQEKLVNDLIKEFTKINPKPTNGAKRFSFDTIAECNKEEERFKATITKHNMTMMEVFLTQLDSDMEEFKKEFGKVIDIQLGYSYTNSSGKNVSHDLAYLVDQTKKEPLGRHEQYEIYFYLVSKTKAYYDNSSTNAHGYCNGKAHTKLYVGFKYERVVYTLESGKQLVVYKIVGLQYSTWDCNYRDKHGETKGTLDELIQSSKSIQQSIVQLANIN